MSAAFLVPDRFLLNQLISELESRLRESGVVGSMRILARHLGITSPARLVEIAYAAYGADSVHLQDGEESYLLFAQDVLRT